MNKSLTGNVKRMLEQIRKKEVRNIKENPGRQVERI